MDRKVKELVSLKLENHTIKKLTLDLKGYFVFIHDRLSGPTILVGRQTNIKGGGNEDN
ncbi:hypothetical protein [Sutcliffiella horikoshii]|uniref:hypothetical protein n=1 Tax=Sutcliffiella horikoshii TaxID=79883 RepID=UPI001CFE2D86|nr:hypothetical protein [Sutcliffiella horikoshii]